ncbi:hypothetical protein [Furfurilactobacillus entadae]|uniref:hypothetical protein n=1 Tax=Furfurilactobacillus entadae TaxID=2922307 RepID=UPI0035E522E0
MSLENLSIREAIEQRRLRYWEVAQAVGITSSQLSVWLRTPLNDTHKQRVEDAIKLLSSK